MSLQTEQRVVASPAHLVGYGQSTSHLPKSLHLQVSLSPHAPSSRQGTELDAQKDRINDHQQLPALGVGRKQYFERPSKKLHGNLDQDQLAEIVLENLNNLYSYVMRLKVFEQRITQLPSSLNMALQESVPALQLLSVPCGRLEAMRIA